MSKAKPWFVANYQDGSPCAISQDNALIATKLIAMGYTYFGMCPMNHCDEWGKDLIKGVKRIVLVYQLEDSDILR